MKQHDDLAKLRAQRAQLDALLCSAQGAETLAPGNVSAVLANLDREDALTLQIREIDARLEALEAGSTGTSR